MSKQEIELLQAECRKLANLLMSPYVFVHETLVEEVDRALAPYIGDGPVPNQSLHAAVYRELV